MLKGVSGDGLRARALRGTALTFAGFGGAQVLRLASNLILTRILFPEAFGLMALVQVFLVGLQMFSDTGINTSILQNRRGDDADFLNTAWTVQIVRGVLLWGVTLLAAAPLAAFYGQPLLAQLLPVAGLGTVLLGFQSTNLATANRHLTLGRLTAIELSSQSIGIVAMVALALWTGSVWALVIGALLGNLAKTVLSHTHMPGLRNRLNWDQSAFDELFHFGKYIFLGSIAGFLVNNADRAILGKFITIGELGIYNIGFFLASVPPMLMRQFSNRILVPIYREVRPGEAAANGRKIRLARSGLSGAMIALAGALALTGIWLVDLLYEDAYALAGPILVLLALSFMPGLVTIAYGAMLLAAGNSRDFTVLTAVLGGVQTALLIWIVSGYGLIGAALAPALAATLSYPLAAYYAHRHRAWDPMLDAGFAVLIVGLTALALWVNDTALGAVLAAAPAGT